MKRFFSLLLPVVAVAALMAPHAVFAQLPTPTPKYGKGGPPKGPGSSGIPKYNTNTNTQKFNQSTINKSVVKSTPAVSFTPPVIKNKTVINKNIPLATPTPKFSGNGKPPFKKPFPGSTPPVINKTIINQSNVTQNNSTTQGTPKFLKPPGPGPKGPKGPKGPGGGWPQGNNNFGKNKNWGGPKFGGGGGGGGPVYNFSNNYGGKWVTGNTYPDWNRFGVHFYNGHHYRWFNGGWLIVDGGFWPTGYYTYQPDGSKIYNTQAILANMGYYNGTVDGIPGPATRQAIADYQADNGLPVDGHLNPPTQVSLGLIAPDGN